MAQLLVIGTGLIGSSVAAALRSAGCFDVCVGFDADRSVSARAVELGLLDAATDDPYADTLDATAVVVAVPPPAVADAVVRAAAVHRGVPIFDVGSVKGSVIDAVRSRGGLPGQFVPCHPMAGTAQSGPDAADAGLFRGRSVILTPEPETDAAAVAQVSAWWRAVGACVSVTSCAVHDEMVALTSHLPHLLAYAYLDWLAQPHAAAAAEFAGPGVRDFTRIAGSDPALWRDIFAANRAALLVELDGWLVQAHRAADLLRAGRFDELEGLLARGRAARAQLLDDA